MHSDATGGREVVDRCGREPRSMNPTYLLAAVDVVAVLVLAMAVYHPRHRRADLVTAFIAVNVGVLVVTIVLSSSAATLGLIGGLGTSDLVLSISLMAGLVVVLAVADSRLLHSTGLRQVVVLDSAITGEPTLVERLSWLNRLVRDFRSVRRGAASGRRARRAGRSALRR